MPSQTSGSDYTKLSTKQLEDLVAGGGLADAEQAKVLELLTDRYKRDLLGTSPSKNQPAPAVDIKPPAPPKPKSVPKSPPVKAAPSKPAPAQSDTTQPAPSKSGGCLRTLQNLFFIVLAILAFLFLLLILQNL